MSDLVKYKINRFSDSQDKRRNNYSKSFRSSLYRPIRNFRQLWKRGNRFYIDFYNVSQLDDLYNGKLCSDIFVYYKLLWTRLSFRPLCYCTLSPCYPRTESNSREMLGSQERDFGAFRWRVGVRHSRRVSV